MVKVAIAGGIGSGKSFVCQLLERRGIHVYDCDRAAKRIMASSTKIQSDLMDVVGHDVVLEGKINKGVLASFILENDDNVAKINAIVHPAVANDFVKSGCSWMECAILFSSGFNKLVDKVICVTAPFEVRIDRIMRRDGISKQKAMEWISLQMSQDEMVALSDYEIVNDGIMGLEAQIDSILASLKQ